MNKTDIKKIFGSTIYSRGLDYFERRKVKEINQTDNVITARVKGSNRNIYSVSIELDGNGEIIDSDCSCPYDEYCKHMAAVLIALGDSPLQAPVNPIPAAPVIEPETIDIKKYTLNKISPRIEFLLMREPPQKKLTSGDRWKSVFVLKQSSYGFNTTWKIEPSQLFIKKDGSFGRIASYHKDQITEPESAAEKSVRQILSVLKDSSGPISLVFPYIIGQPDFPLYTPDGILIKTCRMTAFEMSAKPAFVSPDKKTILFSLTLRVADEASVWTDWSLQGPSSFYFNMNTLFFLKDRVLYYRQDIEDGGENLGRVLYESQPWKLDDVLSFEQESKTLLPGFFKFNFNPEPVRLEFPIPIPVIEFDHFFHFYQGIKLLFDYSGWLVQMSDSGISNLQIIDHKSCLVSRRPDLEKKVLAYLNTFLSGLLKDYEKKAKPSGYPVYHSRDFLILYGSCILEEGFEIKMKKDNRRITRQSGKIKLTVKSAIDWFDLEAYFETGEGNIPAHFSPEDLKYGLVESGGNFIFLTPEMITQLQKLVSLGLSEDGKIRVMNSDLGRINLLYEMAETSDDTAFRAKHELSQKLIQAGKIKPAGMPAGFHGELRPYQLEGYSWLNFLHENGLCGLLADDMGLGKTIQALCFLQKLKLENPEAKILIIVPVSTLFNWEAEITRFTPTLTCIRHHGAERKKKSSLENADIILVSYHTLRNDIELFTARVWDCVILDEAQTIKNSESQAFKAVRLIKSSFRLSLTGTPVENRTLDLWSQMDFLHPGLLGSRKNFNACYAKPIEEEGDASASNMLKALVSPFILRRKKEDVAKELPEKEEIILSLEMEPEQKKLYESLRLSYAEKITQTIQNQGVERSSIQIFEALLRLRQAAIIPGLINEAHANLPSCKMEALRTVLEEAVSEGHKILVFSQFVQVLKRIETMLKEDKIAYSYLDGSTRDREAAVKSFQESKDIPVFLLSLKAGGVGINLTSADYVFLFDPWWNPAVERQAVDRSHRIGQDKKVIIYKPIVLGTVEEKILELQNRKKELADGLISEESGLFAKLTEAEILDLFN